MGLLSSLVIVVVFIKKFEFSWYKERRRGDGWNGVEGGEGKIIVCKKDQHNRVKGLLI